MQKHRVKWDHWDAGDRTGPPPSRWAPQLSSEQTGRRSARATFTYRTAHQGSTAADWWSAAANNNWEEAGLMAPEVKYGKQTGSGKNRNLINFLHSGTGLIMTWEQFCINCVLLDTVSDIYTRYTFNNFFGCDGKKTRNPVYKLFVYWGIGASVMNTWIHL